MCIWPAARKLRHLTVRIKPQLLPANRKRGKTCGVSYLVMAGLVPAIPMVGAMCPPDRDRRDEPGDDESGDARFSPLTANLNERLTAQIKLGLLGSASF